MIFFEKCNRWPSIYFPVLENSASSTENCFAEAGYEEFDDELWMIFDNDSVPESNTDLTYTLVSNQSEMSEFIDVFYSSFGFQNIEFGEALLRRFSTGSEVLIQHFIGKVDNVSQCVATLISDNEYACIYNVRVHPDSRKHGYGRAITIKLLEEAKEKLSKRNFSAVSPRQSG